MNLTRDGWRYAAHAGPRGSSFEHAVAVVSSPSGVTGGLLHVRHAWAAEAIAAILNADAEQPRPAPAAPEQETSPCA